VVIGVIGGGEFFCFGTIDVGGVGSPVGERGPLVLVAHNPEVQRSPFGQTAGQGFPQSSILGAHIPTQREQLHAFKQLTTLLFCPPRLITLTLLSGKYKFVPTAMKLVDFERM